MYPLGGGRGFLSGIQAARIWLTSIALTLVGGIVLSLQGNEGAFWPAVIGNAFVVYGFCLAWVGLRAFYGEKEGWLTAALVTLVAFACMAAFHGSWQGRNIVYAVGQSVPMAMIVFHLLKRKALGLGGGIAVAALALGIAGHAVETALNIAAWEGEFDQELYFSIESYALVCVVYSGMVWNIGFIVMAMNRRHGEMVKVAETDDLTGLPNRRHFLYRLNMAEQAFSRGGAPYAVLLIDVDRFKWMNDTHGHAVGDRGLAHFARVAGSVLKAEAVLARTGGDEFCALLSAADEAEAIAAAREMVAAIRQAPLYAGDERLRMTVSIGIACRTGQEAGKQPDMMAQADRALYKVKQAGRDGYATRDSQIAGRETPPQPVAG